MLPQQLDGPIHSAQRCDDVALESTRQVGRMLSDGFEELTLERQQMQSGRGPDPHGHCCAKIRGPVPQLLKVGAPPLLQEVHSSDPILYLAERAQAHATYKSKMLNE